MSNQNVLLVFVATVIFFAYSAAPPYLTKCKAEDKKCIKESTKAVIPYFALGLPEYNVPSLDPMTVKSVNASQGNLLFIVSDATIVGLKNCEPKKIQRDPAKSKIHIHMLCSAILDGQYELSGTLLFVPIEGKGPIHVDLKSCMVHIEADIIDKVGHDGKMHWGIKSWSHTFELKDKSNVVFENLFNGNEVLAQTARELITNNANDIILEIGPKVIKAVVEIVVKSVHNFFKAIPSEELTLDQ